MLKMHSMPFAQILLPTLVASVSASPFVMRQTNRTQSRTIEWGPCKEAWNVSAPVDCARLVVPLDYTDTSNNATLTLDILRLPALKQPAKGSILYNGGGPGSSGVQDLSIIGNNLMGLTGGEHDILNVVPRGTGDTLPFGCFATPEEQLINIQYFPVSGSSSNVAAGRNFATAKVFSDTCLRNQNATGRYIGTAFTARDMMQVVDALGEDGLLRYYGISYGTVLGATVAAMFPDRMDKVILDGVVNSHEYYHVVEQELFTSLDDVFSGFCAGCVAAPEKCSLAQNYTALQLEETIYRFIEDLKYNPIPVSSPTGSLLIDYTLAQGLIVSQLYYSATWPQLANTIAAVLAGNTSVFIQSATPTSDAAPAADAEAIFGIKCGDKFDRYETLDQILPGILRRHSRGRLADERYASDFQVATKSPILLIGNTYDPVTPLASARNMSAGFTGSRVLQHNGYGHCALLNQASRCTAQATRAYFANGTLPDEGTICELDVPLFSGQGGWRQLFETL